MKMFYIGLLIIIGLTTIVYIPSFNHLLRGETYTYYLDTAGHNSAGDLISHWFNYEKVRKYAPGDRWLFKPLLFILDGIQKSLFGVQYVWWRIVALLMHLFTCFSLYRLLWAIKKGWLAILLSLFFALGYVFINTVLYEQIASYCLFTGLILMALYYVYTKNHLWIAIGSLFTASFINETGIFITIAFCLYLLWRHYQKKYVVACGLLIPSYFTIYFIEKLVNPAYGLMTEFNKLSAWDTLSEGIIASGKVIWQWCGKIFLPSMFDLVPQSYQMAYSSALESKPFSILAVVNIIIVVSIVGLVAYNYTKYRKIRPFIILPVAVLAIFTLAIAIFRANTHSEAYVLQNSFNTYMFMAFLMVILYFLISPIKMYAQYVAILFTILALYSGIKVYELNNSLKTLETPIRNYFSQLDKFVSEHQFATFNSVIVNEKLQKRVTFPLWNYTIPPKTESNDYTAPQILYYDNWSANPDYKLTYYPETNVLEAAKQ